MSPLFPRMHMSGLFLAVLLTTLSPAVVAAQDDDPSGWAIGLAAEIPTKYIWRGLELHNDPAFQPDIFLEHGNFSIGAWSSWAFNGDQQEIDTYVSWYQELPVGELTLLATDYFYPNGDLGFFNFDGVVDGEPAGAHTLELGAEFTPSAVPLTFALAWNAYNDPDHALFGSVGSDISLPAFDLSGEVGVLLKDSPFYYGGGAGDVTHYSVTASRGFALGDYEPYLSAAMIRSQLMDKTYWVFAVGF